MNRPMTLSENDFDSELPPLGSTRCYWVLLDRSFNFVYLDPVLSSHMKSQSNSLIGTSFYDYLHPAESNEAKQDIQSIVQSENIHGSIIRVRFVRLPFIRVHLGSKSPVPYHVSQMCADKSDSTYIPLDLVISSIHDGLYLCFFHAVLDKNPHFNNNADSIWTNWCHTPIFTERHTQILEQSLLNWSRYQPPTPQKFTIPTRIFQLIRQSSNENTNIGLNHVIYSWPPSDGSTGEGPYNPSSFASLMSEISINQSAASQLTGAATSCSRRFKARHQAKCNENYYTVESMFIPYGAIIFACFKIEFEYPVAATKRTAISPSENSHQTTTLFDSTSYDQSLYLHPQPFYQQAAAPGPQFSLVNDWTGYSASPSTSEAPIKDEIAQQQLPSPVAPIKDEFSQSHQLPPPPPPPAAIPVKAPLNLPEANTSGSSNISSKSNNNYNHNYNQVKPNTDKVACTSCGKEKSPEWRRGPSGKKDLCNACGLRYARAISKSETSGATLSGRRKKSDSKNNTKKNKKASLSPNPSSSNLTGNAPLNLTKSTHSSPNLNVDAPTLEKPMFLAPKDNDIPFNFNGFIPKSPQQSSNLDSYDSSHSYPKLYNQEINDQYQMSPQLPLQLPPQQRNLAYINPTLYSNDNSNANQFQFNNASTNANQRPSFLP
ncbi:hypothetical protein E3P77_01370 [Wallemia ichthyophaga]|nr:hypothetical protein E3P77_01370 [Wallemia ichthyophaga]